MFLDNRYCSEASKLMSVAPVSDDQASGRIGLTERAAHRIAALKTNEGNDRLRLRVTVSGGGCSGFQYGFSLDDQEADDDVVFERNGVQAVIDEVSLGLLEGAEVDYVEDLVGSYFAITNPNAASTCGCGSSFSI